MSILLAAVVTTGCASWPEQTASNPGSYNQYSKVASSENQDVVIRAQGANTPVTEQVAVTSQHKPEEAPGTTNQYRQGMPVSGAPIQPVQYQQPVQPSAQLSRFTNSSPTIVGQSPAAPAQYEVPPSQYNNNSPYTAPAPIGSGFTQPPLPPPITTIEQVSRPLGGVPLYNPPLGPDAFISTNTYFDEGRTADIMIQAREAQTGRFQFGMGVNSDAGVTMNVVIDERNFDWRRYPTSMADVWNGQAFRGAGQGFRLEAMPGSQVQRYMVTYTNPYLFNTRVSLNASGYLFDRIYRDWDERRVGGRFGLGYRLAPDISTTFSLRMENVRISDARVSGVPALDSAVGKHGLYSGQFKISHDTRDLVFQPTEGHLLELSFEQVFGSFTYPRLEIDYRKYFLLSERPDRSGRHTLGFSTKVGFSGDDTPIFENFFAGGFSTLRGFDFRRTGPVDSDVYTGGPFRILGSVEYSFPITADDMLKGVIFTDLGAVEESTKIVWEDFAVSPGFGMRVSIPALGQAPIALDFAFPINHADTDQTEVFSFFIGYAR
ncbi:MAG: hypothetical protein COA78_31655 [Blastopirellula sp.]|nr:MAG: hypothetical protein COA78_31655 [Blastopirellula sp.]